MVIFLTFAGGRAYAQRVSLRIKPDMNLPAILGQIEAQTGYHFVYDPDQAEKWYLKGEHLFDGVRVEVVLKELGFVFSVKKRFILLKGPVGKKGGSPGVLPVSTAGTSKDSMSRTLEEVYVIGYGTVEAYKVSSSLTKVNSDQFNKGSAGSPLDLIRGKVAGLSITRTGGNNNPNLASAVQLRGVTTLSTQEEANQPLIVVDGIPGGNLDLLQQDDILSFDILKDGAAAAIYGARGNAGVILITTKRGTPGSPSFEYSAYLAHDALRKRPEVLSAADYRRLMTDPSNPYKGMMTDYGGNTDYYQQLMNPSNLTWYHYLAASGGTVRSNYRASLFYTQRDGIVQQNANTQYGGRININQRGLRDMFSFQTNFAVNIKTANLNGGSQDDFEQAVQQNPTQPEKDSAGNYFVPSGYDYYNPVARLNQQYHNSNTQLMAGDVRFVLQPLPSLKATATGAFARNHRLEDVYYDKDSKASIDSFRAGGFASKSSTLRFSKMLETTLEFQHVIRRLHSLQLIAGYSFQEQSTDLFSESNSGFLTDGQGMNNIGSGSDLVGGKAHENSQRSGNRLIAFLGRMSYVYANKYVATVTLRHEGSSRFGANHKWGNFPALSLAWNMDKEKFLSGMKVLDKLKIRGGYGVTGNQNIPDYESLATLGAGGQYLNDGSWFQTYGPNKNPNPDLRWEKKQETNAGFDFGLFQDRVTGSLDFYRRLTTDLLASYNTQVPPFVTNSLYTNVGAIANKGIELSLKIKAVAGRDFGWDVDLIGSTQRNKLVSLSNAVFKSSYFQYGYLPPPGSLGYAIRAQEGVPLGSFYGKRFAGFTPEGKWLFYKADGSRGTASQMTTDDLSYIGNGVPKYMASLGNSFRYRRWGLTVFMTGKFGYKILNMQNLYFGNKKWLGNNVLKFALTRYGQLNDDPQYSNYYLEKGDFIKLDNVTLTYELPLGHPAAGRAPEASAEGTVPPQAGKHGPRIRSLRFYVAAQSLAVITGYSGLDPEVQDTGLTTGIDNRGFYPPTRTFTAGLNIEF